MQWEIEILNNQNSWQLEGSVTPILELGMSYDEWLDFPIQEVIAFGFLKDQK